MDMSIKKKISETPISQDVATEQNNNSDILNKLDILVLNKGWNDKNEKLIVGIGYNCGIYKQLHEQSSKYYKRLNKGLNLSLLILSIFLTTDSIINLLKDDILIIIQRVIIFIVAIISIINNFLTYGELSEQHLHAAKSFNIIYNDIRNTMCIYKKDRINAIRYMQQTIKEYDHLEISSPEIAELFIKEMEKKIKTDDKYKDISMPINQFREIEVIIDNNDNYTFNTQNTDTKDSVPDDKTSNKFKINNMQNIQQIHECFKIDGELSENDNITIADLEHYRRNGIELQTQYEFNRFMRN
jgi:hypothetical protein